MAIKDDNTKPNSQWANLNITEKNPALITVINIGTLVTDGITNAIKVTAMAKSSPKSVRSGR